MDETELPQDKVLFRVTYPDGSDIVETLWAFDVGDWHYRLDNRPAYAYGVSCGDIVYAPFSLKESLPTFERVATKCGNRTIRIFFDKATSTYDFRKKVKADLVALGFGYETMTQQFLAFDFPPEINMDDVTAYLESIATIQWEHVDPSYEELYPEEHE